MVEQTNELFCKKKVIKPNRATINKPYGGHHTQRGNREMKVNQIVDERDKKLTYNWRG